MLTNSVTLHPCLDVRIAWQSQKGGHLGMRISAGCLCKPRIDWLTRTLTFARIIFKEANVNFDLYCLFSLSKVIN